ncbi:MAG: class I SAM-dependent DNA methyltransferase, partial [Candidatus Latescibacteria bacterium]|nr:class I SAM-dependent DNA methyltransferase [Candidatus Latescibacterota bacterium]
MQQQLFLETHQNDHLFSDHYLNDVLPRLEIWKEAEGTTEVLEKIRKRYLRFRDTLPSTNEPQLETDWVRPILRLLGHYFEPQVTAYLGDDTYRPDYTFFANEEARLEARKKKGCNEIFKTALAVGDAKYWDRPLDKKIKGKGNPFDNSNPNYQIDIYLRATAKKWGLLTNGRLWRLYNRDTSFSMDSFY